MQHPIMLAIDGGGDTAGEVWDARAEVDVALMIRRYLAENPAPAETRVAWDFQAWASALEHDGRVRLAELEAAALRVV